MLRYISSHQRNLPQAGGGVVGLTHVRTEALKARAPACLENRGDSDGTVRSVATGWKELRPHAVLGCSSLECVAVVGTGGLPLENLVYYLDLVIDRQY